MFRRLLLLAVLLLVGWLAYLWRVEGVAPWDMGDGVYVATGMGAKLACSGRYVSGFDDDRLVDDLASYSSVQRSLALAYLPHGVVEASLWGLGKTRARYRPGMGCTLELGADALDQVSVSELPDHSSLPWPAGSRVEPADDALRGLLQTLIAEDNAAGFDTRALLVAQHGSLLAEAYGPGISRDTALMGWSMGKSVTAVMLGRLEALGLANVNETGLFSEWEGDERAQISLEQLLQMTSGLAFAEDYVPGTDVTRMLFMSREVAPLAIAKPLLHTPGSFFSYSSGTTNMLSRLIFERVGRSPQAMADFFRGDIAVPMALEHTVLEPDSSGVLVGSSFVYASARDWARFGQLFLDGGVINGQRILPEGWTQRAAAPNQSDNDPRYGYQLWLNGGGEQLRWGSLPPSAYAMLGNRGQVLMVLPELNALIVRLGWSRGDYPTDGNFARILAALPD